MALGLRATMALAVFALGIMMAPSVLGTPLLPVAVQGGELEAGGSPVVLQGINDQTVFYIQFYWLIDGYSQYRYSNHLFDSGTGHYDTDTTTRLDADGYRDFWWRYFWILHGLGFNLVRLGVFDTSPLEKAMDAWYGHRAAWDEVFDPMLDMAEANGVYIAFNLGGSNAGETYLLDESSEEYAAWTAWCGALMAEYADEPAIAWWDLYNEPWSESNMEGCWNAHGGYAGYMSWRDNVSVIAQANAGSRLVSMDGMPEGWGQSYWDAAFDDHFDLCDLHGYWSVESTYLISDRANWSAALGRPLVMGECALNAKDGQYQAPWWWYWPWMDDTARAWGAGTVWMTLWDYPGYPLSQGALGSIPDPPGDEGSDPWGTIGELFLWASMLGYAFWAFVVAFVLTAVAAATRHPAAIVLAAIAWLAAFAFGSFGGSLP